MDRKILNTDGMLLVAIDIAKVRNEVLVRFPDKTQKRFKVSNNIQDYREFSTFLHSVGSPCLIGFEATGNYHRPLAYHLQKEGFTLRLISSLSIARTREAMYNSWDKNDPKDCKAILHMLQTGIHQTYCDPLVLNFNDVQEISKTYHQISLHRVRVYHSILTHYLPLYFPEADKYMHSTRAEWIFSLLLKFPNRAAVLKYTKEKFIKTAWKLDGWKENKRAWLTDFYETAAESIGIPVEENSEAIHMFRIVLQEYINLCKLRSDIEKLANQYIGNNTDCKLLKTIPGIGPICALIILAEAGDLRRFSHYKKFLKFCGLDLCTQQSGQYRGVSKISKHGNSQLRYAFWMAATVAIRMRENTFRKKYENYINSDPDNKDLKRKAYVAVAAKIARVAYSLIKFGNEYRCFHDDSAITGGKIPPSRAVEASF